VDIVTGTRSSLGSTELSIVDRCDRLAWYHDIRRLVPTGGRRGAILGSLIHACLKYWYAQFLVTGIPQWWIDGNLYAELDQVGKGYPTLIEQAKELLTRYIQRWGDIDRAWRVLAIEEEYSMRLGDMFGIGADVPQHAQLGMAISLGLTHPRIGIDVARGDLEVRPSIRVDIALECADGTQNIMDYKSTIGQWGKMPKWSKNNDYGLMWQPYEYSYIARNVRYADGTLVFPRLESFIIQRILTTKPEDPTEMIISDRNTIEFTGWVYRLVPYLIARQVARRANLHAHVHDPSYAMTPDNGPLPTGLVTGACMTRFGLCDYYAACRSENPEGVISQSFRVDGEDAPRAPISLPAALPGMLTALPGASASVGFASPNQSTLVPLTPSVSMLDLSSLPVLTSPSSTPNASSASPALRLALTPLPGRRT